MYEVISGGSLPIHDTYVVHSSTYTAQHSFNLDKMVLKFATIPSGVKVQPKPFTVSIPDEQIEELKTLVRLSKTAPPTYEGSQDDGRLGVPSSWLANAKEEWKKFDW